MPKDYRRYKNKDELKFQIGQLAATRAIAELQEENENFASFVNQCFNRFIRCDWGDICEEDWEQNDEAVRCGDRILAVYQHPDREDWHIWIITEWDRSATTILFPSEY